MSSSKEQETRGKDFGMVTDKLAFITKIREFSCQGKTLLANNKAAEKFKVNTS